MVVLDTMENSIGLDMGVSTTVTSVTDASCERWKDENERTFGLFTPFPDAEPAYLKENLAFTVYADYTKKWYQENNIPPLSPIDSK